MDKETKAIVNDILKDKYPGSKIKWQGNDPTLIIPDNLEKKQKQIIRFITSILLSLGIAVEFYPEKAVRVS
jgi:hypothetical protein